jgi:hypothetical protein
VNDELENIFKKAVVAEIEVVLRRLFRGTEENHEILKQDSRCSARRFEPNTSQKRYLARYRCSVES